ncbi:uncharacterized protein DUF4288 [Tamaricihabitans halophyticus]|uniref:Uncharacterized protein DUF4288 n=1 Tax=Tamaricihabitans halophyticus TaxID=1262583 RepID=A0A4R2R0V9_9PSEU|nr:DUF4288 domain-containing protein [Tamaricihabitans halophyticus]TCP56292.1 uncharacterized protein DUF4288 [Tamaricihabitans halophyticus]
MFTEHYIAVLLLRADQEGEVGPLYQESFTLLTAESEEEARGKALSIGKRREHSYQADDGTLISWKLDHVVDVCVAVDDELTDGAELYSRYFRDYAAYCNVEPLLGGQSF